jgi:copper oxidase (laccase) domain-containing protein
LKINAQNMDVFKFKNLSIYKNLNHGISTRKFGSMKNEDKSANIPNLYSFLEYINMPKEFVCMKQAHQGDVANILSSEKSQIENCDGLITDKKHITLCIAAADCLPVLLYDPVNKVVGVAHAGRRGLDAGIIKNILEKFENDFNTDPKNVIVGVGPGIEKNCYEVDAEFLDLRKIANDQLLGNGVVKENIENLDICTKCNMDEFYSYRGGDKFDRFMSVISLI